MAELVAPELRPAILDPMRSAWYPEACLKESMRAFDEVVTHGDRRRLIAMFEECTLNGVHRFFSEPRSIVPFAIGANKTFFCHRPFAERYAAVLRKTDRKAVEQEFLGNRVVCFDPSPWTVGRWIRKVDAGRMFRKIYHDIGSRLSG